MYSWTDKNKLAANNFKYDEVMTVHLKTFLIIWAM